MTRPTYPQFIKNLPRVKHSMEGVEGWLAQGKDFQIVFFEIEPTANVPAHSHSAQFGVVMEGEIALTIGAETRIYAKGDTYSIPKGVVHHAKFNSFALVMDFFAEPDRYEVV